MTTRADERTLSACTDSSWTVDQANIIHFSSEEFLMDSMRTAFKHQWLDWSHCYLSVTAACGNGQMVSVPGNVWHKNSCGYSLYVLLIELMTGRQTRVPPLIPTHTIFRFNQSQGCCFYRCLTLNYVPNSFSRWYSLCLAVC